MNADRKSLLSWLVRYGAAVVAVAAAFGLRLAVTAWVGPGLPTYITFYPAVMVVALLAGFGPGLLATALTGLTMAYWILPPEGFAVNSSVEALGLALFGCMGLFMSAVAELYRRKRRKAADYERELAVRESLEALRAAAERERFLAGVIERASQTFAAGYPDGRLGQFNKAYEQLTGYTAEELRSIDWATTLTPPEWRELERQKLEDLNRTGQPVCYEKEYLRKDGTRVPVELLVHVVKDAEGKPEYYYSFISDITERKRAAEKLSRINAELAQRVAELQAANVEVAASRRAALNLMEDALQARQEAEEFNAELRREVEVRKHAEEEVRQSESRFRLLSDTAERLLATEDPQGLANELCRDVMEHLNCQVFFNFLVDESSGRLRLNACAGIPAEEARRIEWLDYGVAVCGCVARDGRRIIAEDILHTPDLRTEMVRGYGVQAYCCHPLIGQGRVIGTLSFGTKTRPRFTAEEVDLMHSVADQVAVAMQRVLAHEKLRSSLREKEVLLKEIHHRVKNNMQVISSLVSLQADGFQDAALRGMLQDVRDRVRSMALVHEKLYQSENLAQVDFAEYARSLLNYLWRAHGQAAGRVRLSLALEPVPLSVETAVPCGLILNELAGNALKHAFVKRDAETRRRGDAENGERERGRGGEGENGNGCEVRVALEAGTDGRVTLRVSDNGTGLPAGTDWRESRSLGLRLVQMLSGQLGGTVEALTREGEGTEFAVTFRK